MLIFLISETHYFQILFCIHLKLYWFFCSYIYFVSPALGPTCFFVYFCFLFFITGEGSLFLCWLILLWWPKQTKTKPKNLFQEPYFKSGLQSWRALYPQENHVLFKNLIFWNRTLSVSLKLIISHNILGARFCGCQHLHTHFSSLYTGNLILIQVSS